MGGWWITSLLENPDINGKVWVVSWIVWVIGSICLHELAHGWAAIKLGDDTPTVLGHMTWNPMVHMGTFSMIMFLFVGIAWGAMPVNPSRMRGKYAESVVAIAGPLMNLALAVIALVLLVLWVPLAQGQLMGSITIADPLATNMHTFLFVGAFLNLVLMMFNLLPIYPLDGGRIAFDFIPAYRRFAENETGRWVILGVFVLLFIFAFDLIFILSRVFVSSFSNGVWSIFFPDLDPGAFLPF